MKPLYRNWKLKLVVRYSLGQLSTFLLNRLLAIGLLVHWYITVKSQKLISQATNWSFHFNQLKHASVSSNKLN